MKVVSNPNFRSITYPKDYEYGKQKEEDIYPLLKTFFNSPALERTPQRYCKYDFEDRDATYEVKSRKCNKHTYPTTLLTLNKIINTTKDQYFIFNFTDEICYIKYDKAVFDTFECKPYSRINQADDMTDYLFIPLANLTTLKIKNRQK